VSQQTTNRYFDELASGLASGSISRGKALRLMGAALVGGTLASFPGIAWAKPNKPNGAKCQRNSQCASGQCVERVCGSGGPTCTPSCPADCDCVVDRVSGLPACVVSCSVSPCQIATDCNECFPGAVCFGEGTSLTCSSPCSTPG
jgi:hypothetical protein